MRRRRVQHGRGHGAAPIERRPRVALVTFGVHHDREASRPLLLELPHHQPTVSRRQRPVHVPHRIARPVLTDPEVVGSLAAARRLVHGPGVRRDRLHERQVPEREDTRQDERPREELRSNAPFGHAERRVRAKLRLDRQDLAPPPRCPEGGHLDPFAAPDRWQEPVDRFQVGVTDGDVASNAARGSIDAELDDRRGALLRLVGNDELDREPAEGGERKDEPGRERPEEQGGEHVEPARLDVRPDQEQDPRAEQQTDRALARAHGFRCLARRAAGQVPPRASAR